MSKQPKSFAIIRDNEGWWEEADSTENECPFIASTMQLSIRTLENFLHEKYIQRKTVVGALRTDELIRKVVFNSDGTFTIYTQDESKFEEDGDDCDD